MGRRSFFAIFVSTLLIVDCVSAGLLQSIREAAMLKDYIIQNSRDSRALQVDQPPSNFISNDLFHFDLNGLKTCPPGDFVCLAQTSIRNNVGNDMSNAIVKSVAHIMTDMLNSTISRSLVDMVSRAHNTKDPKEAEDARMAMSMVTGALQMVSSKVIQAFSSFVKVAISGMMWDLFDQVVKAARSSAKVRSTDLLETEKINHDHKTDSISPSSINSNNLKRATR